MTNVDNLWVGIGYVTAEGDLNARFVRERVRAMSAHALDVLGASGAGR
jgi:hypothetical protein